MTAILGISAFYHDSAAALVVDGQIVAAAQEERFTRKKHDYDFPTEAIDYCLREAGCPPEQLDYVGFYDKPFLKFERLLETYLAFAPGVRVVPAGHAAVAAAEAVSAARAAARSRRRLHRAVRLHRAPRVACRQRVLPVAVRGGRDPHARRRRRVGHRQLRHRPRQQDSPARTSCASRTRWACSTRRSPTSPASRSTRASTS